MEPPPYAQPTPPQQQQGMLADPEEMKFMLQYLDSTLSTGTTSNGLPPSAVPAAAFHGGGNSSSSSSSSSAGSVAAHVGPDAAQMVHPAHLHPPHQLSDEPTLNDDDNGMYNELGDVFSMFFNIDSDEPQLAGGGGAAAAAALAHAQAQAQAQHAHMANGGSFVGVPRYGHSSSGGSNGGLDGSEPSQKVQLARSSSMSSSHSGLDSISPGFGYPSVSPATMNWLQSLGKSPSSESLTGLMSPAGLYGTPSSALPGSAGANSLADGSDLLERTASCEMIDWKAYNEAGEKAQKDAPKWRVIPQHGPHADPTAAANASSAGPLHPGAGFSSKPPTGSVAVHSAERESAVAASSGEGGLRDHFSRQFQTIKSTVVSIVGALASADGAPNAPFQSAAMPPTAFAAASAGPHQPMLSQSAQEQLELAAKKMADEKNKRKAIISPEYVQYGSNSSSSSALPLVGAGMYAVDSMKPEPAQMVSQVPDPTGRRPSKKTLHQTGLLPSHDVPVDVHLYDHFQQQQHQQQPFQSVEDRDDPNSSAIRCKCTGKCRNARCACVKAGFVCGVHCKCVSCANPFVPMESEGIDIQKMVHDVCLMQFLSKVKDMHELLDSRVAYECCNGEVQVKKTIESGFTCPVCQIHYTYSWCNNRLCNDQKKPRKHCAKCRRCGDHRNEHCDECNHCYFAGVANSFSCSCKGGKTGAAGVKTRTVIPNTTRDSDGVGGLRAKTEVQQSVGFGLEVGSRSLRAESLNAPTPPQQQTPGSAAGTGTLAAGLSNTEAEKDDSCPVQ
ncbi:hypothetical protein PybrP1_012732 [[Pythium] brassicae (nom. inval.)]|nr:hypothetical protein PybrP1_012732 [[Pythium] brassicae (nom. inval.)]